MNEDLRLKDDPIMLFQIHKKTKNFYDAFRIKEKLNYHILGDSYISMYQPLMNSSDVKPPKSKRNIKRHTKQEVKNEKKVEEKKVEEKKVEATTTPEAKEVIEIIPFDKRWDFAVEYHKQHTELDDDELQKRYEFIMACRQKQIEMENDPNAKTIIYYPRKAGLGNTVSSLANILLLAMMSNRRFYIYDWNLIFRFLHMPFDNVMLEEPIWTDENMQLSNDVDACGLDYPGILNGTVTTQHIIIRTTCLLDRFWVHTLPLREVFKQHRIIPSTKMNYVDTYHRILQFMLVDVLHPHQDILDAVNEFKQSVHWDDNNVLGMHMRTGLLEGNVGWGRFMEEKDVGYFVTQALRYTNQYEVYYPNTPVKWFVLADNDRVKEIVHRELGDKYITSNCTISHSKNRGAHGMFCSFVQNYLLSDCRFLILTFKSTYGYLAKHRTEVQQVNVLPGAWKKLKG